MPGEVSVHDNQDDRVKIVEAPAPRIFWSLVLHASRILEALDNPPVKDALVQVETDSNQCRPLY